MPLGDERGIDRKGHGEKHNLGTSSDGKKRPSYR